MVHQSAFGLAESSLPLAQNLVPVRSRILVVAGRIANHQIILSWTKMWFRFRVLGDLAFLWGALIENIVQEYLETMRVNFVTLVKFFARKVAGVFAKHIPRFATHANLRDVTLGLPARPVFCSTKASCAKTHDCSPVGGSALGNSARNNHPQRLRAVLLEKGNLVCRKLADAAASP